MQKVPSPAGARQKARSRLAARLAADARSRRGPAPASARRSSRGRGAPERVEERTRSLPARDARSPPRPSLPTPTVALELADAAPELKRLETDPPPCLSLQRRGGGWVCRATLATPRLTAPTSSRPRPSRLSLLARVSSRSSARVPDRSPPAQNRPGSYRIDSLFLKSTSTAEGLNSVTFELSTPPPTVVVKSSSSAFVSICSHERKLQACNT
jgi:hypothetical protein